MSSTQRAKGRSATLGRRLQRARAIGPAKILRQVRLGRAIEQRVEGALLRGHIHVEKPPGAIITIGPGFRARHGLMLVLLHPTSELHIGRDVFINDSSRIYVEDRVEVGDGCVIGWNVSIMDSDFHELNGRKRLAPTRLGRHVWVGAGVIIGAGVQVGDGAVIAAGSVVLSNIASETLVAGSPAREVRSGISWR